MESKMVIECSNKINLAIKTIEEIDNRYYNEHYLSNNELKQRKRLIKKIKILRKFISTIFAKYNVYIDFNEDEEFNFSM